MSVYKTQLENIASSGTAPEKLFARRLLKFLDTTQNTMKVEKLKLLKHIINTHKKDIDETCPNHTFFYEHFRQGPILIMLNKLDGTEIK